MEEKNTEEKKVVDRVKVNHEMTGGVESQIDKVAQVVVVGGVVLGLVALFLGGKSILPRLVDLIQVILGTAVFFVLLRGLAEIIRLLKHSNGIQYGGSLSKAEDTSPYICGGCGAAVYSRWDQCNQCGAQIRQEDQEAGGS